MLWWLSFASEEAPLGIAIVEAMSCEQAIGRAHDLGINPGGEVLGLAVPEEEAALAEVRRYGMDRLVSPSELRAAGLPSIKEYEREHGVGIGIPRGSCLVCEDDNAGLR